MKKKIKTLSQTVRVRDLKLWKNLHPPSLPPLSKVYKSHQTYNKKNWKYMGKVIELVGGGSVINGAALSSYYTIAWFSCHPIPARCKGSINRNTQWQRGRKNHAIRISVLKFLYTKKAKITINSVKILSPFFFSFF